MPCPEGTKFIAWTNNKLTFFDKFLNQIEFQKDLNAAYGIRSTYSCLSYDEKDDLLWLAYSGGIAGFRIELDENGKISDVVLKVNIPNGTYSGENVSVNHCSHIWFDSEKKELWFSTSNSSNTGSNYYKYLYVLSLTENADGVLVPSAAQMLLKINQKDESFKKAYLIFLEKMNQVVFIGNSLENVFYFDRETKEIVDRPFKGTQMESIKLFYGETYIENYIGNNVWIGFYNPVLETFIDYAWRTVIDVYQKSVLSLYKKCPIRPWGIGKKTGNLIGTGSGSKVRVYDVNYNKILEWGHPEGITWLAVNPITEEIYTIDKETRTVFLFDRFGNVINKYRDDTVFNAFTLNYYVLPGTKEIGPVLIGPNIILYPGNYLDQPTETPTFVFRVGQSPDGWTQQFRIVFDRDYNKILNGDENTTYEVMIDTWANGPYYDNSITFYYCDDWDGTDPENGTWQTLGTGDPKKSGGTEPTNGVICDSNHPVKYVKFTLPNTKALTGLADGVKWYAKIFSIVE